MTRHSFGTAEDDDILEIQGVEYHMQPIGMRVIRRFLTAQSMTQKLKASGEDPTPEDAEAMLDSATSLIIASVKPDERDKLEEHINDSVPPAMLAQIAVAITNAMSDLDPTVPPSSSDGSSEAGQLSTVPALPAESIPTP